MSASNGTVLEGFVRVNHVVPKKPAPEWKNEDNENEDDAEEK